MIYEFCAENVTNLEKAMQVGARRIELCDNLAVGGTTPSYGVIKAAVELAKPYNVTVMTMIRPRGGDFVYNDLGNGNHARRHSNGAQRWDTRTCFWCFDNC